jgi:hypothetical protein
MRWIEMPVCASPASSAAWIGEAPRWREQQQRGLQDHAVAGHEEHLGRERAQLLEHPWRVRIGRLQHLDAVRARQLDQRRGLQRTAPTARAIGACDQGQRPVARVDQARQHGRGERRRAQEDRAHRGARGPRASR